MVAKLFVQGALLQALALLALPGCDASPAARTTARAGLATLVAAAIALRLIRWLSRAR